MAPFVVLTFTLLALSIVGGIVLNLYLYSKGVIGKRYGRRLQRFQPTATISMAQEATFEDKFYSHIGEDTDESARYARRGLLVMLGIALTAVFAIVTMVNVLLH